ncbi:MAG TPA: carbonic anhydrase [Geobacteraceae bacterium]
MKRAQSFLTRSIVLASFLASAALAQASGSATVTPDEALAKLMTGNRHFIVGEVEHLEQMVKPGVRTDLDLNGQHPYAIVLTCSDSRVPPEIIFDKGLGEIFTVRVAGNIVAPHELGSIEYGIEHLGASLVVVMGHSKCGAVSSTYAAYPNAVEGNIGSLVEAITPAVSAVVGSNPKPADVTAQAEQVEECVVENVKLVSESLETKSPIIKEYVETGKVKIVRAKYDLYSGKVALLP